MIVDKERLGDFASGSNEVKPFETPLRKPQTLGDLVLRDSKSETASTNDGKRMLDLPFDNSTNCAANTYLASLAVIRRLERDRGRLIDALECLLLRYTGLVESGDCGFWEAEKENDVIRARALLAEIDK